MENTKIIIENIKRYLEEKKDPKYTHIRKIIEGEHLISDDRNEIILENLKRYLKDKNDFEHIKKMIEAEHLINKK